MYNNLDLISHCKIKVVFGSTLGAFLHAALSAVGGFGREEEGICGTRGGQFSRRGLEGSCGASVQETASKLLDLRRGSASHYKRLQSACSSDCPSHCAAAGGVRGGVEGGGGGGGGGAWEWITNNLRRHNCVTAI